MESENNMNFQIYAYPAFFPKSPVDHTYIKFANGKTFSCAGGDIGGDLLSDESGSEDFGMSPIN